MESELQALLWSGGEPRKHERRNKDGKLTGIGELRAIETEDSRSITTEYIEVIYTVPKLSKYRLRKLNKACEEIEAQNTILPLTDKELLKEELTTCITVPISALPLTRTYQQLRLLNATLGFKNFLSDKKPRY
jgi:hypothetical protein